MEMPLGQVLQEPLLSIVTLRRRAIPLIGVAFVGEGQLENERIILTLWAVPGLGRLPILIPLDAGTLHTVLARGSSTMHSLLRDDSDDRGPEFTHLAFVHGACPSLGVPDRRPCRRSLPYNGTPRTHHRCALLLVGDRSRTSPCARSTEHLTIPTI